MAAVSSVMAMAGMAAAPAAHHLSSSSAFESSVGPVQQCGILRLNKAARKMNVAVRASSNEDQVPAARRESFKALVAAGAALALTLSPMSVGPASAGLFDKTPLKKVADKGAISNFPRNEGTGDSVGNNQASRNIASGTPFGEGSKSGSGVNFNAPDIVNDVKGTVKSNTPDTMNPLKDIGNLNPFKSSSVVGDVKDTASSVAGLFDKNVSVERGTSSNFPGNEGTGNSVGNNQGVRGSANSGTPLGEGAGENLVGDNQASRNASSTGTPFGEGSSSGSGVTLNLPNVGGIAEDVENNIPNTVNPLKDIGNLNPFKGTASVPDVSAAVGDAKNAASNVASDVKGQAMNNPVADGAKTILNKGAGVPNPQLNPIEDGKQLINKNSVGSIGDVQSAAEGVASDVQSKALNNPIADGAKTFLNKVAGVPDPQLNPIEDGKQLINKNIGN